MGVLQSFNFEVQALARRTVRSLISIGKSAGYGKASTCVRCGRQLTDPRSIENGIGPVCAQRGLWQMEFFEKEGTVNSTIPYDGGDIVVCRDDSGTVVNVPHKHVYHSPTGFEWGYGGSGAADLALNILALFTDYEHAFRYHQDFKWKYIASLPKKRGRIPRDVVIGFLKKQGAPLENRGHDVR
jgi:hypothetical protein